MRKVTVWVPEDKLSTFMDLIGVDHGLELHLDSSEISKTEIEPRYKSGHRFYNGKSRKNILAQDLVKKLLKNVDHGLSAAQMIPDFEAEDFSPNTVSATLADMKKAGLVSKLTTGKFVLGGKT